MSDLRVIKANGKVYGYLADFDEISQRWYGEISNRAGQTIHTTKPVYKNHQEAIQAVHIWIKNDKESE